MERCQNGTVVIRMTSPAGRQMLRDMYAEPEFWLRGQLMMTQVIIETHEMTAVVLLHHLEYHRAMRKALLK